MVDGRFTMAISRYVFDNGVGELQADSRARSHARGLDQGGFTGGPICVVENFTSLVDGNVTVRCDDKVNLLLDGHTCELYVCFIRSYDIGDSIFTKQHDCESDDGPINTGSVNSELAKGLNRTG